MAKSLEFDFPEICKTKKYLKFTKLTFNQSLLRDRSLFMRGGGLAGSGGGPQF